MSVTKQPPAAADLQPHAATRPPVPATLRLDNDPDLQALVAGLQVGILVQGPGAEILFHNATAGELLGRPAEQLIGSTSFDPTWRLYYPDGRPLPSAAIPVVAAIAGCRPVHNAVLGLDRLVQQDRVWLLVDADPQLAADGSVVQVICTFRDISAYQAALGIVADSALRFQAVAESASDAIIAADSHGRIVFWNGAAQTIFGYTKAEILGESLTRLVPQRYRAAHRRAMRRYRTHAAFTQAGISPILELHGRRKDGSEFPLDLAISTWETPEGTFCSGIIRDTTARSQAAQELRESEDRYRQMFANNAAIQLLIDPADATIVEANAAAYAFYGYPPDALNGRSMATINQLPTTVVHAALVRAAGEQRNYFVSLHRLANGELRTVESYSSPVRVHGRTLLYSIIHDITSREQARIALAESEAKYRLLFTNNPQPLWVHDQAGLRFLAVNDTAVAHYGYSRAEFLAMRVSDLLLPEDQGDLPDCLAPASPVPELSGALRYRCKDGTMRWMDMATHAMVFEGRAACLVVGSDITARKQIELALQESEARYWRLVEQSPEAIVVHDGKAVVYASPAALEMVGLVTAEEIIGQPILSFLRAADRPLVQQRMAQVFQRNLPTPSVTLPVVRPDGQELVVELSGIPIQYQGRPAVQVILQDITERTRLAAALQTSEARHRSLVETSPDAVFLLDLDGRILFCNQQGALLHGVAHPDDLVGVSALRFVAPADHTHFQAALQRTSEAGSIYNVEYTLVRHDGSQYAIEFNATLLRDAAGAPQTLLAIKRDISARKQAEQALRESETLYRSLIETSPDAIILTTVEGDILLCNERAAILYGFDNAITMRGSNTFGLVDPEEQQTARELVRASLRFQAGPEYQSMMLRRDGSSFPAAVNMSVLHNVAGHTTALLGISRDISAQLRIEDTLRTYALQQTAVADLGRQALVVQDLSALMQTAAATCTELLDTEYAGILEYVAAGDLFRGWASIGLPNPTSYPLSGTGPSQSAYALHSAEPVILLDLATETRFQLDPVLQEHGIVSGVALAIRGGGQPFGVLSVHTARRRTFTPAEIGFLQSIANLLGNAVASRRAEEGRVKLAHTLGLLLESVGEGIYGLDHEARCTFINRAGATMLGYSPADLLGRALHPIIHHSYPDGSPYPAEDCPILQTLATGRRCQVTDVILWQHDGSPLPVDYFSYPILEDGVHTGAVVTFVDIRARRQAEAVRRAGLAAEEANAAKNEFLSRMSHELRTPLNAVLGFAQILEMGTLTPAQTESLGYILRAGRHLLTLINEVLDITRVESGQVTIEQVPVTVGDLLQESLDLVRPLAALRQVQLTLELPEATLPSVRGDRLRLLQVLLNLLTNAVKYNRLGGAVTLRCESAADRIHILVRDTGPGLTPAQVARLFTPFERLGAEQSEIEGSGLGLALSRRLVEAMEGTIGVTSVPGQGSTFWVNLAAGGVVPPVPVVVPAGGAPVVRPAGVTRTVLYIEDNVSNLRLVERILESRPNIKLLAAMQGQLGLDLALEQAPDLILLDLQLPDLPGAEVLRRLRANPLTAATPVVIVSADATPAQMARLRRAGADIYLTKPLDVRQLLEVVDALLPEGS